MSYESCCPRILIVYGDIRILCLFCFWWLNTQIKNMFWTWPGWVFKCLNYRISIFVASLLSAVTQVSVKIWSSKIEHYAFGLSWLTPQSVGKKARKVFNNMSHIYRSLSLVMFSVADVYYRGFLCWLKRKYYCHSVRISSYNSNMVCISSQFQEMLVVLSLKHSFGQILLVSIVWGT